MATRMGKVAAVGVLSAILGLVGCSASVDTGSFEKELDGIQGVNGSLVEVQHPGLPTNTDVVVWLFVDSTDVASVSATAREVAEIVKVDDSVRTHQVSLAVVQGEPAQYPTRSDVSSHSAQVMHKVAEELGLPRSAGGFLRLDTQAVSQLTGSNG